MTALAHTLAAKYAKIAMVVTIVSFTSAFAYSQVGQTNVAGELRSAETRTPVGEMQASRVTRCIMPATWRRDCNM
jgi:hypothetical protein